MDAPPEVSREGSQDPTDTNHENRAVMVFCPSLVRSLSTPPGGRLEPNYVGVRRVRPSSRMVKLVMEQEKRKREPTDADPIVSPVVFKVADDNGKERRMTKQEKKATKLQMAQQRKVEKEQKRQEQEKQQPLKKKAKKRKRGTNGPGIDKTTNNPVDQDNSCVNDSAASSNNNVPTHVEVQVDACQNGTSNIQGTDSMGDDEIKALAQVGIPAPKLSLVEQELADLRGERQGVPPVILSPPLAQVAFQTPGFLPGHDSSQGSLDCYCMDDVWAQEWTVALKDSMAPALVVRGREDMRPMAYDIVPEVWSRLRPESLQAVQQQQQQQVDTNKTANPVVKAKAKMTDGNQQQLELGHRESWGLVSIRPPSVSSFDSDLAAVTEVLYRNTALHISCGAKFGCDLLLYDGPRKDRHAFAGLRLVVSGNTPASTAEMSFPVPSPYAVAGYVRCLNTAGKLALLALVRRERQPDGSKRFHVAIVDLKLQRVDGSNRKGTDERLEKLTRS